MMGNHWVSGLHIRFLSIFLVSTTYTCFCAQNLTESFHERERLALLKFKHSVKDDYKVLSSWAGTDYCSWKGVHCDGATRSVVDLHLRGNYRGMFGYCLDQGCYYLVGDKVNACLAELTHLKHLDLSGNDFQGSLIPAFIGSFKQLRYLNLSNAGFGGIIPHHIGNLSNLKVLDLGWSVKANDMAWISGLSSLEHLDLAHVDFVQATNIYMIYYMIPSLTYLSLSDCELSNVDLVLHFNSSKKLPAIKHLDLSNNNLEGQLPHFFQNFTSLEFLDLSSNNLSMPWNSINLLNTNPSLLELHLSWCGLHNAPFSNTYFNSSAHSNIQHLDLSNNFIEDSIPSELMNMTSLRFLDLSYNILNSSIHVMPNLLKLDVSFNYIYHIELVGIWRQCYLKELSISGNYFKEGMIATSTNMSECSHYAFEILNMCDNQLKGPIPESLERLASLRVLRLMSNGLKGSIPEALKRLRSLEVLDLSYNELTGSIPIFLGKLTKLELSNNRLNGSIPESLGRLTGLTLLDLGSNKLTGPIPASLGRLASLQEFSVSSNMLNGKIPVSIGQLTKLTKLDFSFNSLEGVVFESHFANLSMLKDLTATSNHKLIFNISHEWIPPFQLRSVRLGSCKIAHGFPQWLQTQRKLETLVLTNSSLYGLLPTWLREMPLISYLDISHNKLVGSLVNIPFRDPINGLERIEEKFFLLQDNLLNGSIPRSVCIRTLIVLDVSLNKLSGNIPECVWNLEKMSMLILSSNGLSGVLPSSLGNISSSLAWLKLDNNNFRGKLPQNLENLRYLKVLDLGNNEFVGSIPKWIGESLQYLMVLRLHKNNLTGRIPRALCKCSYLHILDVAHNKLTGSIPHCFGNLSAMIDVRQQDDHRGFYELGAVDVIQTMNVVQVMKGMYLSYTKTFNLLVFNMDLSSNKLVGEIPPQITILSLLVGLNLSHNHLSGSIPDSIGNMKELNSLDLSFNHFSGIIPPSMADLNFLSSMNLSHNNLSGPIPTGNQLQTLTDPFMYAGNGDLCGAPLPNNCSNHDDPTTATSNNKHKDYDELEDWFYLSVMCGLATGFWGVIGVLLLKKQWRYKLFVMTEVAMDIIYVAVLVRVSKMKRIGRDVMNNNYAPGVSSHMGLTWGCPIILIQNIDPSRGLCNGTRLICKGFYRNAIDAEIVVRQHSGERVFLIRIPLSLSEDDMFPFDLIRKQFPIRLCFSMTINKAQGQTIPYVGIYLLDSVFSHGQLYVTLSRGISRENTKVLVHPAKDFRRDGVYTSNVVYHELLREG